MGLFDKKNKKTAESNKVAGENDAGNDYREATTWETCHTEEALKSRDRAWFIASAAVFVAVLLAVAIIVMVPLKEAIPYLVKVDAAGGIDVLTTMKEKPMQYEDVIDKYWLAKYVRSWESWEYYTAQEDYEFIGLTSSPSVAKQYALLFQGPKAIDQLYGQQNVVTTKVVSVVPNGNGIATVRFEKTVRARNAPEDQSRVSKWIATIGYDYKKIAKMKESERLKNPLGFNVDSYRTDPEMLEMPAAPKGESGSSQTPVVPAIAPQGAAK